MRLKHYLNNENIKRTIAKKVVKTIAPIVTKKVIKKLKNKNEDYFVESDEKIKRWLNAEIGRTKGNKLSDYSERDIQELIDIYKKEKDIKKAVNIWSEL